MHSWLLKPRARFYDVVREERGVHHVVEAGLCWEDAVAQRLHHETRDPPPKEHLSPPVENPRCARQPGRRKFATDPALIRAGRSHVEARRPFCTACKQHYPSQWRPREFWLEPYSHRAPDGTVCPGGPRNIVVPVWTRPPRESRSAVLRASHERLEAFVVQYLVDRDAEQALLRAGYKHRRRAAHTAAIALQDRVVLAAIARAEAERSATETSPEPTAAREEGEPTMKNEATTSAAEETTTATDESTSGAPSSTKPYKVTEDKILIALFCREWPKDKNGSAALLRAGYKRTNAPRAARLLLALPAVREKLGLGEAPVKKAKKRKAARKPAASQPTVHERLASKLEAIREKQEAEAPKEIEVVSVHREALGHIKLGDLSLLPTNVRVTLDGSGLRVSVGAA